MDINGFKGLYRISSMGRVKSLWRVTLTGKGLVPHEHPERIMKPSKSRPYDIVALCKGGKLFYRTVHRLVAVAFVPNPLGKPQVNHKDGNKRNNKSSNLEWVMGSENIKHAIRLGLLVVARGSQLHMKLMESQVEIIKSRLRRGDKGREIAKDYGVDESLISMIKHGTIWKHVPG